VAAYLVKLEQQLPYMSRLRDYLAENPALVWLLGFPLTPDAHFPWGFDVQASLPSARQFGRVLRSLPQDVLQFLLEASVRLIGQALPEGVSLGETISGDTKHILAWVQANNPKAYVSHRFDPARQPSGDPDCRLGCKRRHNQAPASAERSDAPLPADTPPPNTPAPAPSAPRRPSGEFYWGYASGVVATQVPHWGEFVLAELTQPGNQADLSFFLPLMQQVEQRLGQRPRFGAFDAAFDAWYVYEYFHRADGAPGFAAVPFVQKGGYRLHDRHFDEAGLPLCAAGLAMPLKVAYTDRTTTLVPHQRGKYVCPLRFPQSDGRPCPIQHAHAAQGCSASMPLSIGARLRYQLDRTGQDYQRVYRQRTAVERINAQACALGIERPKLRHRQAIANQNTLIYVLINLRALRRIRSLPLSPKEVTPMSPPLA
jgi:hypothetical protein